MQAFDSLLKDHQRALLPDGFSVLESAVIQHNIRSVAGMYDNITLDQLAALLGLSVSRVETLTCDMISEGRLKGHVDQVRDLPSASMNARARLTAGRDWGSDFKPMYSKMDATGPVKKEICQDRRFIVSTTHSSPWRHRRRPKPGLPSVHGNNLELLQRSVLSMVAITFAALPFCLLPGMRVAPLRSWRTLHPSLYIPVNQTLCRR